MTTFNNFKSYAEWIDEVKKFCVEQDTFDYYSSHYSFITAFEEKMTPKEAFKDCHEWMSS